METPVGEHIRRLEERLLQLSTQIMENSSDLAERNRIEAGNPSRAFGHWSLSGGTRSGA
jgi:hypothetical protein